MLKSPIVTCALFAAMLFACVPARSQSGSDISPSEAKELYDYTLTMDKVQKAAAATHALMELAKQHPELNSAGDSKSLDGTVQIIQRYPEAVAAISHAGLTPRDYVLCSLTTMQAAMAVGFKKAGTYKEYPAKLLQLVSKANLDFTEQHWDEIQKLTASGDSDTQ